MSTRLLQGKQKRHSFQDDLESFLLVALFYILRFTIHNHIHDIKTRMHEIFDDFIVHDDGAVSGGSGKKLMFLHGDYFDPKSFRVFGNAPLTSWLFEVTGAIKQWLEHCEAQDRAKSDSQPEGLLNLSEGLEKFTTKPNKSSNNVSGDPLKLQSHDWILAITKNSLKAQWPQNEARVPDQNPTRKRRQTKMDRALGSQSGAVSSHSVKRSREPEHGPSQPGKKSKHDN
jgi:hypothetical protein